MYQSEFNYFEFDAFFEDGYFDSSQKLYLKRIVFKFILGLIISRFGPLIDKICVDVCWIG